MANIILSKESSNNELKCYFEAVLKLSQSDNQFPINLWEEKARVQIMLEERTKDIEIKNSLMAFLVEMKLHGEWQKYKADRQLKETVKRLKTEQKKKESRPYELPF